MEEASRLTSFLSSTAIDCEVAGTGRDAQLMAYNVRFSAVLLDLNLRRHSAFEVLKYFKVNRPSMKVIAYLKNPEMLEKWEIKEEDIIRMGANVVLLGPKEFAELKTAIDGGDEFQQWKKNAVNPEDKQAGMGESDIGDEEFTSIRLADFINGNTSFFDFYVRLGKNRYIKVLLRGDKFSEEQVARYQTSGKLELLYFKNSDRRQYVNYMNEITQKILTNDKAGVKTKSNLTRNLLDKYVEEVYVQGLPPDLYEEGEKACKSVVKLLGQSEDLSVLMRSFEDIDPAGVGHCTLTTFYSAAIIKNLEWGSDAIIEKVTMGAILHDIGKLKLSKEIQKKHPKDMNEDELREYQKHPQWGYDLVKKIRHVPTTVKHIIMQHHERNHGDGFPQKLQGMNIFPPAKIVAFADFFAHYLVDNKSKPMDAFEALLKEREILTQFDGELVKALIKAFIVKPVSIKKK